MKIAIYETNLLWSERLRRTALALGHEPTVIARPEPPAQAYDVGILNLSEAQFTDAAWIASLHACGMKTVGHAGHKEKTLWTDGETAGVQTIVSNGTLHHKLAEVLAGL